MRKTAEEISCATLLIHKKQGPGTAASGIAGIHSVLLDKRMLLMCLT